MCTAISFVAGNHYFGRNLDLEERYDENVTITPRNYILKYKSGEIERRHFAFIGTATVINDYPLYYDATNEFGLSIAGLNFVGNSYLYNDMDRSFINLAPYELIPYILGKCQTVKQAVEVLENIRLVDIRFAKNIPNAQLHWLISDKEQSVTFEYVKNGARIYDNIVGVLTNNPTFDYHMMNLNNYMSLSNSSPVNCFDKSMKLNEYSRGMGAIGLPGDFSSSSRFIKAAFVKANSVVPECEEERVSQTFHILDSVSQVAGSVMVNGKYERTQYTSCCNTDKCIYYYKTYNNSQISTVNMYNENIDENKLISYKMSFNEKINYIN